MSNVVIQSNWSQFQILPSLKKKTFKRTSANFIQQTIKQQSKRLFRKVTLVTIMRKYIASLKALRVK